jgi:hypothetical protein
VGEGEAALPDALALEDAGTLDDRRELLVDQPDDLGTVLPVVAVVDLAHEAVIRPHPGDDSGSPEDGVGAAAEVPGEGNVDGDGLDAADVHVVSRLLDADVASARRRGPLRS